ncbi:MAG: MBOAT family O-acyltransferase [Ardenticatenaceae bacterium]
MLFNSIDFLIFFPIVVTLYYLTPFRYRWALLLAASYYFYMSWKAEYLLLIVTSTLIDYCVGIQISQTKEQARRKTWLLLSLFSNFGILLGFKYFNFFGETITTALNQVNIFYNVPAFDLLLPVGISFYTFQSLSYSIDVYRGEKEAERHLGIFALYVAFFPQLVAGPIERSTHLLPQFYQKHEFDYDRVTDGLKLMLWGFFKKLVIADRLALVVDSVYGDPHQFTGSSLIVATYFFAFQIYCDFSGYSDMAIGAAQVLGFDLMKNFRQPYFASSVREFWSRWHISLSTWFRDYLYIPLGGNRVGKWRWYYNLMVVFLLSGLWHGANWTFVAWGALHAFYMLCAIWTREWRSNLFAASPLARYPLLKRLLEVTITFHLVTFAWLFFRANTISDAFYIITHLFVGLFSKPKFGADFGYYNMMIAVSAIALMTLVQLLQERGSVRELIAKRPRSVRWAIYYVIFFAILLFGQFGTKEFIYFQF